MANGRRRRKATKSRVAERAARTAPARVAGAAGRPGVSSRRRVLSRPGVLSRPAVAARRDGAREGIASHVALVLLCVAPLAVVPGGENRFVFGKLAAYCAAVGVACLTRPKGKLPRPVVWLLTAGFVVIALSALTGAHPYTAVVGAAPRYEGLPVLALYAAAGWSGARLLGPDTPECRVRTAEWALTVTALVVGFIAILETAGLRPLSSNLARPGSLLGTASDEGALGVLIAGVLAWMALHRNGRAAIVPTIGAAAASVTVALSASRAALVGLLAAAAVVALGSPTRRRVVVALAVIGVAVVALVAPGPRARITGTSRLATQTVHGRVLLWKETLGLVGRHPLIGIGPGTYLDAITREHDLRWQKEVGPANPPDSAHNFILQVASVGGLALLADVGGLCVLTVRSGRRQMRGGDRADEREGFAIGAFAGLVGYGVALLFGFTTPGSTPLAAAMAGIVLAEPLELVPDPERRARTLVALRSLVGTGAAALLVLSIMASVAEVRLKDALDSAASGDVRRADSQFKTAQTLRWWDPSVAAAAGHAFVVIAQSGPQDLQPHSSQLAAYWIGRAHARLSGTEQVQIDQAALAELRSDYSDAARVLSTVLKKDRYNPAVLLRLGVVQGESGQLPEAAATLLEVTRIDPKSPDPWSDLSIVYKLEGQGEKSVQAASIASRLQHSKT